MQCFRCGFLRLFVGHVPFSSVYSNLVGYQTSDIRFLWTVITKTMNPSSNGRSPLPHVALS